MELGLKLSLTEEKDEGLMITTLNRFGQGNETLNKLLLIGRVISHISTNFEALRNVGVLEGRPWTFDKNLVILESIEEGVDLDDAISQGSVRNDAMMVLWIPASRSCSAPSYAHPISLVSVQLGAKLVFFPLPYDLDSIPGVLFQNGILAPIDSKERES
ncbi:hypothetical protein Salat_2434400 [Sesamum alatum]|uniref:Uncharacterized protein n=1 Tax=Sesamum alatum TaxID=300844 RepID=A0AAE2CFG9_9LAMI|nr:hypothetical protein Salat_2434400 [Sesamum alatum]